ncbi:MAG: Lrp/AsnC family transcriptional regulator, partial [Methylococcales bacterium]|nr:Lrp/AsnC family transcriptional regulator [Methylococcales bacterium]
MIEFIDRQLIEMLQHGLPLVSRPYAVIGAQLELSEDEVISRLSRLKQQGLIKR